MNECIETIKELKKELKRVQKILNEENVPFSPKRWGANKGHQIKSFKHYHWWLTNQIQYKQQNNRR